MMTRVGRRMQSDQPTAFLVPGHGFQAVRHIVGRYEQPDEWKTRQPLSLVFYTGMVSQYVHLTKVTQTDEEIVVEYKAVPHRSRELRAVPHRSRELRAVPHRSLELSSHAALIPLRFNREGNVPIRIKAAGKGLPRGVCEGVTAKVVPHATTDYAKSTTLPAGEPWQARLVALETSHELDLGLGNRIEEYREALKPGPAGRLRVAPQAPKAPKVWLDLEIKNASKNARTFYFGNDSSQVMLDLAGPGAETLSPMIMMSMEFRMGKPVTLQPGQTHRIPIRSLSFGQRGVSKRAYWTQAGTYELTASYCMVTERGGGGRVVITAAPVKLEVFDPTPGQDEQATDEKAVDPVR
jgi:hypothetical protein